MKLWKRHRLMQAQDAQGSAGGSAATTSESTSSEANTNAPGADGAQANAGQPGDTSATQQTPTDKPAEPGATDGTATAPVVPETYEFTMPEGVTLDPEVAGELSGVSKDLKLTQEQAQKIADLGAKQAQKFQAQQVQALEALSAEWAAATEADPEIGGAKLEANLALSKKVLAEFGTPELNKLLSTSQLGNNPEVIRLLAKVGQRVSVDSKAVTGASGTPQQQSLAQRMYPGMNP